MVQSESLTCRQKTKWYHEQKNYNIKTKTLLTNSKMERTTRHARCFVFTDIKIFKGKNRIMIILLLKVLIYVCFLGYCQYLFIIGAKLRTSVT